MKLVKLVIYYMKAYINQCADTRLITEMKDIIERIEDIERRAKEK